MTRSQKTAHIAELIKKLGLNKSEIARKSGIANYTFNMKLRGKPNYTFTDENITAITTALNSIGCEILATLNKLEQE